MYYGRQIVDSMRLVLAEIDVLLEKEPELNAMASTRSRLARMEAALEEQLIQLKNSVATLKSR